jgi:glutathione S-transferase
MSLKVFADLLSQPSRGIYIFCKAANIPFDFKSIRLAKLEHKTEEFAKVNPFQVVPAIEDNGVNIIESVAILRYLTNTHKVADHWYPKEPLAQARIDEYLSWQHANTR